MSRLVGLTLKHPWPYMMLEDFEDVGPKRIENRDWHPKRYNVKVGDYIALHGGKTPRTPKELDAVRSDLIHVVENILQSETGDVYHYQPQDMLQFCVSGIYAVARLADIVTESDDPWFFGEYGLVLDELLPLMPTIAHPGALGFWEVQPHAITQIRAAWRMSKEQTAATQTPIPQDVLSLQVQAQQLAQPAEVEGFDRIAAIQEILKREQTRGIFWQYQTSQDQRSIYLKGLPTVELQKELAVYRRYYRLEVAQ